MGDFTRDIEKDLLCEKTMIAKEIISQILNYMYIVKLYLVCPLSRLDNIPNINNINNQLVPESQLSGCNEDLFNVTLHRNSKWACIFQSNWTKKDTRHMVILYIIFPWPIKLIPDLVSKLELDKLV
jgi:hypothetical protein